ncbi:hypothetical protein J5N97_022850 [Dioscorea zingiberensis]|uniref:Uncharacterized protein n=1 Tax=Dioscorea zingiberensis TaxID=325984 RepID=A0A9D5CB69_9LILI|nr:hypothetical protein J5N97_022850 [Dioscorea zingiberensis]
MAVIHADLYGNPPPPPAEQSLAPPPPFKVAGKQFPPETTTCNDPRTACFGKTLQCPDQCPEFRPADPKAKACFIDCNRPSCETGTCRVLRLTLTDRSMQHGSQTVKATARLRSEIHQRRRHHVVFPQQSQQTLRPCLRPQHPNQHVLHRPPPRQPLLGSDFTWIQSLGLLFSSHSLTLSAIPVPSWDTTLDHLSFTYDSTPFSIDEGYLSSWTSLSGDLTIERTAMVNSVTVTLRDLVEIMVTVVPVTKEDDRIHKYQIPADDCFAHLEVQFKFLKLSERVEGVLGQTYRPDFQNPVKRGVLMPVMSGEERYVTESLVSPKCKRCIFSPEIDDWVVEKGVGVLPAMDCTSELSNGFGVVCRR